MSTNPPKPDCLAFIVCEGITKSDDPRRTTIYNSFNRIKPTGGPWYFYVLLMGLNGEYRPRLSIEYEDSGAVDVPESETVICCRDQLQTIEHIFHLDNVRFQRTGFHWFKYYLNGQLIAQRRIEIE